jgi:hypothetical protein
MDVKVIIPAILLLLLIPACKDPEYYPDGSFYYWYGDEKIELEINYQNQYLLLEDIETESELKDLLIDSFCRITRIKVFEKVNRDSILEARNMHYATISSNCLYKLESHEKVYYYAPFFKDKMGNHLGLTHLFHVKLNNVQDTDILDSMSVINGVRIVEQDDFFPLWFVLSCSKESNGNALEMANYFKESGLFNACEPSFMQDTSL